MRSCYVPIIITVVHCRSETHTVMALWILVVYSGKVVAAQTN